MEKNITPMVFAWTFVLLVGLSATQARGEQYDKSTPTPTLSEVRYGPHERNVLDFWRAKSEGPTPLVFIVHGGGWSGGNKERADRFADIPKLLDAGISAVSINYRLIPRKPKENAEIDTTKNPPVHAPLHDAARALQFVRSKAEAWNIDKDRVGAAGGSAGACSSLWLLYHDDLAEPDSDDPIARESTRLTCAAVMWGQTTLDPAQKKQWMPNSVYGGHAFGLKDFASFLAAREDIIPWIKQYSPYHNVTKDDPPAYLLYARPPAMGQVKGDPTHSANYGVKLQEHCKELGVACELVYPGAKNVKHKTTTDYLIAVLKAQAVKGE